MRFDLLTMPSVEGTAPLGTRVICDEDLNLPEVSDLLARGVDHVARLAAGDRCIAALSPDGTIVGLVWANLATHVDDFLGEWSRPTERHGYLNQLMVHSGFRSQGVGQLLIRSVRVEAAKRDRSQIHCAVQPSNTASLRAFRSELAVTEARLFGVRLGTRTASIRLRPN